MKRIIYVAGVNRKHLAEQANSVPYWLLSATLLRKYPSWLESYMRNRTVIWDPGTFTEDCISYQGYRAYLDRHAKSKHMYMQYDEIGNPEATEWYLNDMRRRGYEPIPILQPGGDKGLLQNERMVFIGGTVPMSDGERMRYLDDLLGPGITAKVHLLGMMKPEWFAPYQAAVQGDNTSWIPRSEWNRRKSIDEWMQEYGKQWIPHVPRNHIQMALF
ncbi:hypothetical protein PANG_00049 [Paenibacillus phage PG1]|uniref:hypothetical protein n=1 Tax=Paenibacillus phage PG1 TaxID=754053 RepID=UPI0003427C7C|nr:hypothetical protein PANG_00049 [Paenibacillus phage PG1]AGN33768.1 hypothetical protein PANG_00049 [Paenibacillus phage PG1]